MLRKQRHDLGLLFIAMHECSFFTGDVFVFTAVKQKAKCVLEIGCFRVLRTVTGDHPSEIRLSCHNIVIKIIKLIPYIVTITAYG